MHYLDEEEHEVFQLAGRVRDGDEQVRLAKQYRQDMHERLQQ